MARSEVVTGHLHRYYSTVSDRLDDGERDSLSLKVAGKSLELVLCCPAMSKRIWDHLGHLKHSVGGGLSLRIVCARCEKMIAPDIEWTWSAPSVEEGSLSASFDNYLGAVVIRDATSSDVLIVSRSIAESEFVKRDLVRALLRHLLEPLDVWQLHAASVGLEDRGLLLTNRSGSGKTSLTLAGISEGFSSPGDDFVLCSAEDSRAIAHSLFRSARVTPGGLVNLPTGEKPIDADGKSQLNMDELASGAVVVEQPLVALVVPTIGKRTRCDRLDWAGVAQALFPTSIRLSERPTRFVAQVTALLSPLPAYTLQVGRDISEGVEVLRDIIASGGERG